MPALAEMMDGARVMVETLTDIKPGETALIILDTATSPSIAEAVAAATRERGGVPIIALIDRAPLPNTEPPAPVAAAMLAADIIFCFVAQSLFHTKARHMASEKGARILSTTGIVENTLVEGIIKADFFALKPEVDRLTEVVTEGLRIRVTAPGGTDITADIQGRIGNGEVWSRTRGEASGAPSVEVNIAPIETSTRGTIVVDGSAAMLGLVHEPIHLTVEGGRVTKIEGGAQAEQLREILARPNDPRVYVVAEIGIGMNPEGKLTGNMIEDEAAFGTAHLAVGNNALMGGQNSAPIHVDMIIRNPTIEVDGKVIVAPGHPSLPGGTKSQSAKEVR